MRMFVFMLVAGPVTVVIAASVAVVLMVAVMLPVMLFPPPLRTMASRRRHKSSWHHRWEIGHAHWRLAHRRGTEEGQHLQRNRHLAREGRGRPIVGGFVMSPLALPQVRGQFAACEFRVMYEVTELAPGASHRTVVEPAGNGLVVGRAGEVLESSPWHFHRRRWHRHHHCRWRRGGVRLRNAHDRLQHLVLLYRRVRTWSSYSTCRGLPVSSQPLEP